MAAFEVTFKTVRKVRRVMRVKAENRIKAVAEVKRALWNRGWTVQDCEGIRVSNVSEVRS